MGKRRVDGHTCHARQESDQMVCHRCGIRWDMNDPEPPACRVARTIGPVEVPRIRAWMPLALPDWLAEKMAIIAAETPGPEGLKRAYAVFLEAAQS